MTKAEQYIKTELEEGRLTPAYIAALTRYFQAGEGLSVDYMPGPDTLKHLERFYPAMFAPQVVKPADIKPFLSMPLPLLPGKSSPQARKPQITSSFRPADRKDHNGVDIFYRWEDGDEPKFVGDGGCEGKLADGSPRWVVPYGTYCFAAAYGVVTLAGPSPTGYRVWVDHGNGLRSGYFHLQNVLHTAGERVPRGASLGLVGHNPSGGADGRHLHFEVSLVEKYSPLDPEKYLLK